MVRERNSSLGTGGLCFGDVVFAARRGRLAGAALLGEVRVAGHAEVRTTAAFEFRICNIGADFVRVITRTMRSRYFVVQARMQRGAVAPPS